MDRRQAQCRGEGKKDMAGLKHKDWRQGGCEVERLEARTVRCVKGQETIIMQEGEWRTCYNNQTRT
jgi:hypothetical protein